MRKNLKNKKWYSIIIIITIIWFLILLTSWVFRLIQNEFMDNRILWNYVKSYFWAETAQEIALLQIKEIWYWVESKSRDNKDLLYPYDVEIKKVNFSFSEKEWDSWQTSYYKWKIAAYETDIIPLFYIEIDADWNESIKEDIEDLSLTGVETGTGIDNLTWNIVSEKSWISWVWGFLSSDKVYHKYIEENSGSGLKQAKIELISITDFMKANKHYLENDKNRYLILYNASDLDVNYILEANDKFTKPEINIISMGEIKTNRSNLPDSRVNLSTKVNFHDLNSRSKYSIFSP